jgi:peptide/nickel transport system permease protein
MKSIDEIIRFIIFLIVLFFITSILTSIRVKDSQYLLMDAGVKESDISNLKNDAGIMDIFIKNSISFFTLNFGKTITGEEVNSHILNRLEPTFILSLFAITFGSTIGIVSFLAVIYLNRTYMENAVIFISKLILSTPIFLFSILFFIIFFLEFGLLPPGGYERWEISYLLLPGISLGMRTMARIIIFGSEEGKSELNSPLIKILKSRGYSRKTIVFKYILLKVAPLIIILIILDFSSLLSGAMIVEEIFFFPGIGKSTFTAIKNMDENLLRALLIYSGIIFYCMTRFARFLQFKITNIYE